MREGEAEEAIYGKEKERYFGWSHLGNDVWAVNSNCSVGVKLSHQNKIRRCEFFFTVVDGLVGRRAPKKKFLHD